MLFFTTVVYQQNCPAARRTTSWFIDHLETPPRHRAHHLHCSRWGNLHYPFVSRILDRYADLRGTHEILRSWRTKPLLVEILRRFSRTLRDGASKRKGMDAFPVRIESPYAGRISVLHRAMSIVFSWMSTPAPRSRAAISSSVKREISNSTLITLSAWSKEIFRTPYTSWTQSSADISRSPGGTRYRKATSMSVMITLELDEYSPQ